MIYLQQDFDLHPASPATRDRFVELAGGPMLEDLDRLGGRLLGAWSRTDSWFFRQTQVIGFDDLAAFDGFRRAAGRDARWQEHQARLLELARRRQEALLEPLGPVPPERLERGIADAAAKAAGVHALAILEVAPGRMPEFRGLLEAAAPRLPILASWRAIAGNPDEVLDLWAGDPSDQPYLPNRPELDAFFGPLREVAPKERLVTLRPLPYSPLR